MGGKRRAPGPGVKPLRRRAFFTTLAARRAAQKARNDSSALAARLPFPWDVPIIAARALGASAAVPTARLRL